MSQIRQIWVMGNWKMNPKSHSQVIELARHLAKFPDQPKANLMVAPSYLHLLSARQQVGQDVALMAQDICAFDADSGAYTGDISAEQLSDIGVQAVLIGHSERRQYQFETDDLLILKMQNALSADLQVVFCVGEQLAEREADEHFSVVEMQIKSVLETVKPNAARLIVAYEPVWAIGSGLSASAQDAQAMHVHIRQVLSEIDPSYKQVSVLYGGSVKPANASELAACDDIDGVLVGGASLDSAQFLDIYRAFG